ncbi:ABC transporter ATP-binding protein [Paenibacillus eucommiae]|uniref:ABC-type multidrug transport system ATPase subunit n=1 Tax=Paenibacillus eucommiae TaxID=1355755 RepID=A0ABS4J573_9BACL|nr:ABC transporter ATP-binding protein [Paenibacillus eucommiae]MBP1994948.1 ABC-type multidrug transport system ATPase subunit [Paenibacillus eucommiae]
MIEIRDLGKKYKTNEWALQGIELHIEHGMFGLLGPNGAGKTTLIRILATLLKPTTGGVKINDVSLQRPEEIRKVIGYLPQIFQIYPQLTALEFLDYVGVMKGITDSKQRRREIDTLLAKVNLTEKAKKKVKTFSGGMKQRLGIAQALLGDPQVLIVDEPTAGLDPEERVRFRNLLAQFSVNRTVILSTHIVADIESSCNQLAVLTRGKLALSGTLQQLQAFAENHVWEIEVSDQQFAGLSHLQIVSSRRSATGGLTCKVIAQEQPVQGAIALKPTLEDGYLALIGGGRRA